jgi:hypothetical protein
VFLKCNITLVLAPIIHIKNTTLAAHFVGSRRRRMRLSLGNNALITEVEFSHDLRRSTATLLDSICLLYKGMDALRRVKNPSLLAHQHRLIREPSLCNSKST